MQIELRPYQKQTIDEIDEYFRQGRRRIILWAQVGAGKTVMASWLIKRAIEYKYPVIFVVRGRELVKNASETLDSYGIDHSINMAGHHRYNQRKIVQICSIDTLKSRKNWPFKNEEPLIILDEADLDYSDVFEQYPTAFFIGPTGTPFSDNSSYDAVVNPLHGFEIRDLGYLVPEKIYCPHLIDVTGVKKVRGDFDKKQLESVVNDSKIVGDIVSDWLQYGERRPTLVFAVSVEHSLRLKQEFCDRGIRAVQVDADSTEEERNDAKTGLLDGSVEVVVNVNLFSRGWNAPWVSCIVFARPTYSLRLYLQMLGRGLRAWQGKENCIVLDNAGNVYRHGGPYRIREVSLEAPGKKKSKPMDQRVCTCEECFFVFDPEEHEACPECGWIKPKVIREVKTVAGELTQYFESEEERNKMLFEMMRKEYYRLEWVRKTKKLKPDWTFIQLKKKYAPEIFSQLNKVTVVPPQFIS